MVTKAKLSKRIKPFLLEKAEIADNECESNFSLRLRCTLKGHTDNVYRMALSPDGQKLASPSADQSIRIWDLSSLEPLHILKGHPGRVINTAWSPDGRKLASGGGMDDHMIFLWDVESGERIATLKGHTSWIRSITWLSDGKTVASSADDKAILFWNIESGSIVKILKKHTDEIESLALSPDGRILSSGSRDGTVRLWDVRTGEELDVLRGHGSTVFNVTWSPDGKIIASSSADYTVRIWNVKTGRQTNTLQGHVAKVRSISFLCGGRILGSLAQDGTVIMWRSDIWTQVAHLRNQFVRTLILKNITFHPNLPVMFVAAENKTDIHIWEMDLSEFFYNKPTEPTVQYINAKVVLLGESGVGKSGLGIRMAEHEFRATESTHGAQFWQIPLSENPVHDEHLPKVHAELTLWDLAGQPEYRLVHQLFLDDTDVALLLFDCSDPIDPFRGVTYWAKVLKKQVPPHAIKLMVSARCDVSPVTVATQQINEMLAKYGLDHHFMTSAKTNRGVNPLFQYIIQNIPWEQLPRTTAPQLFEIVRQLLLEKKELGESIIPLQEIQKEVDRQYSELQVKQADIDTVITLLQARGFVHRLEPQPQLVIALLKPELINQYASSIIQAARNHPLGIGSVPEREALTGLIPFSGFERLSHDAERIILEATLELLIRHDLCFREMGFFVFPSQINVTRPTSSESPPIAEITYRFSGSIETIYASLVVRLSHTNHFQREDQWKYAVEFSRNGIRLGFSMNQVEEGTGELEVYFYDGISEFDRVTFIRFITDHLRVKGINIEEHIRLYCNECYQEINNFEAIEKRVTSGYLNIPCQYCGTLVFIPKSIEERYHRDSALVAKQTELEITVKKRTEQEVKEFKIDQRSYAAKEESIFHILHLSDIHLNNKQQATQYRVQLETDLIRELRIRRLHYLVISGDIADSAAKDEYMAAFEMLDGLVKRFGLDSRRISIAPGNHDISWDSSEESYKFIPRRKLTHSLEEEYCIQAGDVGVLLRDDLLYQKRFDHFNKYFYKKVYGGQDYPIEYCRQGILTEVEEDSILFLALNSCWQTDHHYTNRYGINTEALAKALDQTQDTKYDNWLKIAVWHNPVAGKEMMNDDFIQLLAIHGFKICMHGHIHEAIEAFHKYDNKRGIYIIGAGTFGAPSKELVAGIPLQYNLITYDACQRTITVNSRKKEKADGAWSADARWGDKNMPKPYYTVKV